MGREERAAWGRVGGLTTGARLGGEAMTRPARRAFRRRFERQVDPDGRLSAAERAVRAERAMRAYMLRLAQASASARTARRVRENGKRVPGSRRLGDGFVARLEDRRAPTDTIGDGPAPTGRSRGDPPD